MNKTTFDFQGDQMGWIYNSLLKSVESKEIKDEQERELLEDQQYRWREKNVDTI